MDWGSRGAGGETGGPHLASPWRGRDGLGLAWVGWWDWRPPPNLPLVRGRDGSGLSRFGWRNWRPPPSLPLKGEGRIGARAVWVVGLEAPT